MASFTVPIACPSWILTSRTELVFTSSLDRERMRPVTAVVDLAEWPPKCVLHEPDEYTLSAAVNQKREALLFSSPSRDLPRVWELRFYNRLLDAKPVKKEASPISPPDLSPIFAVMDEVEASIERAQTHTVDEVVFVGDLPLLVPTHCGIGRKLPLYRVGGGEWQEPSDLPPFLKTAEDWRSRPTCASVTLGDGAAVLLWNRGVFEWDGRRFVRSFEHEVPMESWDHSPLVPRGKSGFFCLAGGHLFEVERGSAPPKRHLEELYLSAIQPGPGGTLLLDRGSDGWWLYDPDENLLSDLSQLTSGARHAVWAAGGFLVVGRGTFGEELCLVSRSDIDALPKTNAEQTAEENRPKPRTETDAFESGKAKSRQRVAVTGPRIYALASDELRAHDIDAPLWQLPLDEGPIAVAAAPTRVATLDAVGVFRLFDESGKLLVREHVVSGPRSLIGSGRNLFAVLGAGRTQLVGDLVYGEDSRIPCLETRTLAFEAGISASFDATGGELVIIGERRSAAYVDVSSGDVTPLPACDDPVHAIAYARPGVWLALGSRGLYELDVRARTWTWLEQVEVVTPGDHLAVAPDGKHVAFESSERQVQISSLPELAPVTSISYPDKYQNGPQLRVTGLGFLDSDRLVVGLSGGHANIAQIASGTVLRLDPIPGAEHHRWVFIFGGSILVAD